MMKTFSLILFLVFPVLSGAQSLKVGLSGFGFPSEIACFVHSGSYRVLADGIEVGTVQSGDFLEITWQKEGLTMRSKSGAIWKGREMKLRASSWESEIRLRSVVPRKNDRIYQENLIFRGGKQGITAINELNLEKYVAGVVESEAGKGLHPEYYKVQAIISRTYALANKGRHITEGFHVCDEVHCQAYGGKARFDDNIILSSWETKGIVIVDEAINLITAAFHSNCGGRTLNAEDVWSKPLPYLVSVKDSFCLHQPHAHWEHSMPKTKWLQYLENKQRHLADTSGQDLTAYFPSQKELFFANGIPLKEIRSDLGLRSTWFSVYEDGTEVKITGRGFGHGVGLCQEGAMKMTELGFKYNEILHFYYKDVHLLHLSVLEFFRDP